MKSYSNKVISICLLVLAVVTVGTLPRAHALYPPKEMTVIPPGRSATADVHPSFIHTTVAFKPPNASPSTAVAAAASDTSSIVQNKSQTSIQEYQSALFKTALTVAGACLFGVFLTLTRGKSTGYEFFASYLVEQSLSIDNIFVFLMLFEYFQVPTNLQNRVLQWGIAGAVTLRGIMIMVGVTALQRCKSVLLAFAAILLASSVKLLTETNNHDHHQNNNDLKDNFIMKIASFLFPNTTHEFHGQSFFVMQEGRRLATPLFLCLVCVELSDFVFAVDSIPAVLGVTQDPLVVYASNIFAIMALRSLYTIVATAVSEWVYLKPAVALVLGFVGTKMIAEYFHVHVSTGVSLGVICSLLSGGVALSVLQKKQQQEQQQQQRLSNPGTVPPAAGDHQGSSF